MNDLLRIEIEADLIKHSKDYDQIINDEYILFSFIPKNLQNNTNFRIISKPFNYIVNPYDTSSAEDDITLLASKFYQVNLNNFTDAEIISITNTITLLVKKLPNLSSDLQIKAIGLGKARPSLLKVLRTF